MLWGSLCERTPVIVHWVTVKGQICAELWVTFDEKDGTFFLFFRFWPSKTSKQKHHTKKKLGVVANTTKWRRLFLDPIICWTQCLTKSFAWIYDMMEGQKSSLEKVFFLSKDFFYWFRNNLRRSWYILPWSLIRQFPIQFQTQIPKTWKTFKPSFLGIPIFCGRGKNIPKFVSFHLRCEACTAQELDDERRGESQDADRNAILTLGTCWFFWGMKPYPVM